MAVSPHGPEDPFTQFLQLERLLAPGPDVTHMVYASSDAVPGTLQTEAYWHARVAHVPELRAKGEAWAAAIWRERQERAELIARAPGIEPHYYIGITAITHLVQICNPQDAAEQLEALSAIAAQSDAHIRLVRRAVSGDFCGPYEFGQRGRPGFWPHGLWSEELSTGAAYADPAVDFNTAHAYAAVVETLQAGLALSEVKSAELLDLTAEIVAAGRWAQWGPSLVSYRFANVL